MKNGFIKSTLEACCKAYFGWEKATCIANSGGSTADLETGYFYVNWSNVKGNGEGYCVRACYKEDSSTSFKNCDGINETWDTTYKTAEKCCGVMESYVNKDYCIAKSEDSNAPFEPTGSLGWYVKYSNGNSDCFKDCTGSDSECDALDLSDTWTVKYDIMDDCCKRLPWKADDDGNCPAQADY